MKIITIKGDKNTGKTTAIRNIHQKISVMKDAKLIDYKTAGHDGCDFDAVWSLNGKTVVIRSYGDQISNIRDGLNYSSTTNADVFINAWSNELNKDYNLCDELKNYRKDSIHIFEEPIKIDPELQKQRIEFTNKVVSLF